MVEESKCNDVGENGTDLFSCRGSKVLGDVDGGKCPAEHFSKKLRRDGVTYGKPLTWVRVCEKHAQFELPPSRVLSISYPALASMSHEAAYKLMDSILSTATFASFVMKYDIVVEKGHVTRAANAEPRPSGVVYIIIEPDCGARKKG